MADIKINKTYSIRTDTTNYMLIRQSPKGESIDGFYPNLSYLFEALLNSTLRKSDAKTLGQWAKDLDAVKKDINRIYNQLMEVK